MHSNAPDCVYKAINVMIGVRRRMPRTQYAYYVPEGLLDFIIMRDYWIPPVHGSVLCTTGITKSLYKPKTIGSWMIAEENYF